MPYTEHDFQFARSVDIDLGLLAGQKVPDTWHNLHRHGELWPRFFQAFLLHHYGADAVESYGRVLMYEKAHASLTEAARTIIQHKRKGGHLRGKPRFKETVKQLFGDVGKKAAGPPGGELMDQYYPPFKLIMEHAVEFAASKAGAGQLILAENIGYDAMIDAHRKVAGELAMFRTQIQDDVLTPWSAIKIEAKHELRLKPINDALNFLVGEYQQSFTRYHEAIHAAAELAPVAAKAARSEAEEHQLTARLGALSSAGAGFAKAFGNEVDLLYNAAYEVVNWARKNAETNMTENFRAEYEEISNRLLIAKQAVSTGSMVFSQLASVVIPVAGSLIGGGVALLANLSMVVAEKKVKSDLIGERVKTDKEKVVELTGYGLDDEHMKKAKKGVTYGAKPAAKAVKQLDGIAEKIEGAADLVEGATSAPGFLADVSGAAGKLDGAAGSVLGATGAVAGAIATPAGQVLNILNADAKEYRPLGRQEEIERAQTAVRKAWDTLLENAGLRYDKLNYEGYDGATRRYRVSLDGHQGWVDDLGRFEADDRSHLAKQFLDQAKAWPNAQGKKYLKPQWATMAFESASVDDWYRYFSYLGTVLVGENQDGIPPGELTNRVVTVDTKESKWYVADLPVHQHPLHIRLDDMYGQLLDINSRHLHIVSFDKFGLCELDKTHKWWNDRTAASPEGRELTSLVERYNEVLLEAANAGHPYRRQEPE